MNSSPILQSSPAPLNRFPSCVLIELEGVPVKSGKRLLGQLINFDRNLSSCVNKGLDLLLTIRFGQETIEVPGGKITFGLRRGELKLKLTNCKMPLKEVQLASPFGISAEQNIRKETELGGEGSAKFSVKSGVEATVKIAEKTENQFTEITHKVHSEGSVSEPTWLFQISEFEECLRGLLKQEKLGTISLESSPCSIDLTFEAPSKKSICLTNAEGLWPSDIDKNKLAIIERKIALILLEKKIQPFLTRLELTYL